MKTKVKNNLRAISLTALAFSMTFLTSCGSSDDLASASQKYVKLGDYKGVEVSVEKPNEDPTDAEVNDYIDDTLIKNTAAYAKDDSKTVIAEDDIVNVDYMGLLDGDPFDGGTASDVTLDVKNNCDPVSGSGYIDGFSSGLVGHSVGETVDCPVTFPSDYSATDLAGKDVIFRFTINYICVAMTHENLTDEYVKTNFEKDTVADFMDYARGQLISDNESEYQSNLRTAVMSAVENNAEVDDVPDSLIDQETERYKKAFMSANDLNTDADLESFISRNYGLSHTDFEKQLRSQQVDSIDRELVFMAIAEKEGIKAEGEEYENYMSDMMLQNNYSSAEEAYKEFLPEDMMKDYYRINKAIDFCVDNAKVD